MLIYDLRYTRVDFELFDFPLYGYVEIAASENRWFYCWKQYNVCIGVEAVWIFFLSPSWIIVDRQRI